MTYYTKHVFLCTNQKPAGKQCCANSGGEPFFDYLKTRLLELNIHGPGTIRVSKAGCLGRCASGPCMVIYPEGIWYRYASFNDIEQIIERHFMAGTVAEQFLIDQ